MADNELGQNLVFLEQKDWSNVNLRDTDSTTRVNINKAPMVKPAVFSLLSPLPHVTRVAQGYILKLLLFVHSLDGQYFVAIPDFAY